MIPEGAITLAEAAKRLNIRPVSLRAAIARGRLSATKISRDWYIEESEVERYRSRKRGRPAQR